MNLFKALSNGHGKISETNITSFLSYLLNQTSELGLSFSTLLLGELNKRLDDWLFGYLKLEGLSSREIIEQLERKYFISCDPEVRISSSTGTQVIDSILSISNKESDILYILIENKINSGAKNLGQCYNQFVAFRENEDYDNSIPVINLLITNEDKSFQSSLDKVKTVNHHSVWLMWVSNVSSQKTIFNLIQELLALEQIGSIPPINLESQSALKNFNDFIWSELYPRSKRNTQVSINGVELIDSVEVEVNGKVEMLARYKNQSIRFLNQNNEIIQGTVKAKLRIINTDMGLNISLKNDSGNLKNTRTIGKEVIEKIKELQFL